MVGRKNRRVIPACIVKAIRQEFPEESDEYAGYRFKAAEIDLNYIFDTSITVDSYDQAQNAGFVLNQFCCDS